MPFREKSAWIMSVALLLGGLWYFGIVSQLSDGTEGLAPPNLPTIAIYTALLVIVAVIGHIVIGALTPREANAAPDEREQLIIARAGHRSGFLLGAGVLSSLAGYLLTHDGNLLFYGVFASLMLAQLAEYLLQIAGYRLGI